MEIQIIKNKKQYEKSLQRFEEVFLAKSTTKEGKEAQLLALVIKDYEDKHYKIEAPDPVEAIKYKMEQMRCNHRRR